MVGGSSANAELIDMTDKIRNPKKHIGIFCNL
jgi:hypothetical protein